MKVDYSSPAVVAPYATKSLNKGHKRRESHSYVFSENPNPIDQMSELSGKFFFSPPAESFEKGNKRFTVADVLRLVSIKKQKAFDDSCGGVDQTAVDRNKFDTMKQKYRETNKKPKHCFKMVEMPPPRPPLPPLPCGSKLVYMGNLSPSIKESDVLEFFKDIGKVDWVKFMVDDVGFLGFGHVRFETYEAGRKALEHNGEELLDRPVKLLAAEERTIFDTFTPSHEHKYLLMGNLNPDIKEKDIIEFFKDAGEVRSVRLINEDGHFLGHAHVEFASSTIAHKAVRYYGQMLLGYYVELVLATEESVWYSRTPSIKKLRGYGMGSWPGHGPTLGPFCCNCTHPRYGADRGRGYGAGRGRGFGAGRGRGYWADRGRGSCHV